jgi:hypothetical protein
MGTVRGTVPGEVSSEEFIERQLHEFDALRQGNRTGPEYEAHFGAASGMLHTQITEKLMVNKFVLALVLEFSFYFSYQDYWTEESMLECGEPHFQRDDPVKNLGKVHRIHAVVNNHQEEHQSTVLETSGTVADQTLSI